MDSGGARRKTGDKAGKGKKNREALHQDMVARRESLNVTKSGASAREYPLFQMPETAPKRSTWVENVRNGACGGSVLNRKPSAHTSLIPNNEKRV